MRVQDQPAYILHHRPFRDTSQVIDVLSRDHGRLSIMSRGSLSARSRLKAVLQPFVPLIVSWSGKGEMPTLTSAEILPTSRIQLRGKSLPSAFYINELLMHLLHKHDVHEEVFGLYESVLGLLNEGHAIEPVLRLFEKQLLEMLGFGLVLDHCVQSGNAIEASLEYAYYLEHGPIELARVHDDLYLSRLSGQGLIDLKNNTLETETSLREAKRLMRSVINYYLGGKVLKSRELFR